MKFAFPNGIPKHHSEIPITNDRLEQLELSKSLDNGCGLYLNTTPDSTVSLLNNEEVFVMERTPKGMWVVKPTNNIQDSQFHHLFYKNKSIPSFSGVNNILPLDNKLDNENYQNYYDIFKQHPKTSNINFKGQTVKILPDDNSVLFPDNMKSMTYRLKKIQLVSKIFVI